MKALHKRSSTPISITPPHHPTQAARSALCESLKITMPCMIEKIGKYFMLDMGISRGLALKVTLSLVSDPIRLQKRDFSLHKNFREFSKWSGHPNFLVFRNLY